MSSNVTKKAIFHYLQVAYFYLILYAICDFNGFDWWEPPKCLFFKNTTNSFYHI